MVSLMFSLIMTVSQAGADSTSLADARAERLSKDPAYELFLRAFRDHAPRKPIESDIDTLPFLYEQIKKFLESARPTLERLEAIRYVYTGRKSSLQSNEVLVGANIGWGVSFGLETGAGTHSDGFFWGPHLRVGIEASVPSDVAMFGAMARIGYRRSKTERADANAGSPLSIDQEGDRLKGGVFGVGGYSFDSSGTQEVAAAVGFEFWGSRYERSLYGTGLRIPGLKVPTANYFRFKKALRLRDELLRNLVQLDLYAAESTFRKLTDVVTLLSSELQPVAEAILLNSVNRLQGSDPLASPANLFNPYYFNPARRQSEQKSLPVRGFISCAKVLGLEWPKTK